MGSLRLHRKRLETWRLLTQLREQRHGLPFFFVLGGATVIGHDSVVGWSVWLTKSVDPRTTVVLERPKLRIRSEAAEALDADANYSI